MSNQNSGRQSTTARGNSSHRSEDAASLEDVLSTLFAFGATERHEQAGYTNENSGVTFSGITLQDVARLLSRRGASARLLVNEDDEFEDEPEDFEEPEDPSEDELFRYTQTGRNSSGTWFPLAKEPQAAGLELLASGDFGRVGVKQRTQRSQINVVRAALNQRPRAIPLSDPEDLHSNLVPNTNGTTVATYDSRMYTASFSNDSSFYYTCAQDFKLHIFDMKTPPDTSPTLPSRNRRIYGSDSLVTSMPVRKVIQGHPGSWTITDANLSSDNERLIYASIASTVYMTSTAPDGDARQTPISFADPRPSSRRAPWSYDDRFSIWSCRFSADGNEVVAGGSGKIFVYDLLANRRTVKISAHNDDVNSCCWADTGSGNVLVSASDDTFLKVWDRRSLGASNKPSGVLIGHTEGITYVSAKGDGRYVISNGKDQSLRLWDLRKMRSSEEHEAVEGYSYGVRGFDYRNYSAPKPRYHNHPKDCSVMTYRGHSVLRTLIRCHFSPSETTGAQYIYSGSADGRVHIWSLDGRIVQVLDRSRTLPSTFFASGPEPLPTTGMPSRSYCVRDVSWHTYEPVIMSAGWGEEGTAIARHEYKGLSKMGGVLEDWIEKHRAETTQALGRSQVGVGRGQNPRIPGAFDVDDE
ncbi:WD40-repeat-containing domain protein [Crepidotus variabilis]|uniref:WD40-repeat-containing domain protein n=1 Tax=Crepidotus variabilis TaxID=179855 RepID=A0A9P6JTE5_9AGAR|nr:WD40-repeat-containing domain protein [Crepidotus variabilis]